MIRAYRSISPRIHPSAFIDDSAQVIGDVEIAEQSSLWMNVVVRGDVNWIRIGRRTNLQDATIVHVMRGTHPTTIGDEVTVGHGVILHGCTVNARCLIGMRAVLLNGVEVGPECIIAAGSLLVEGTRVPPGSLVMGSPARVKRALTPEEIASIGDYAERYVGYRMEYMNAASPGGDPQT